MSVCVCMCACIDARTHTHTHTHTYTHAATPTHTHTQTHAQARQLSTNEANETLLQSVLQLNQYLVANQSHHADAHQQACIHICLAVKSVSSSECTLTTYGHRDAQTPCSHSRALLLSLSRAGVQRARARTHTHTHIYEAGAGTAGIGAERAGWGAVGACGGAGACRRA